MPARRVFFVASTGRCGTRPLSWVLRQAANAVVEHEPQPVCYEEGWRLSDLYSQSWEAFLDEDTNDEARYPELAVKGREYLDVGKEVYGHCLNSMYPFFAHFSRYYREKGVELKCIHLLRNPVDTAASILRAERPARGDGGWRRFRADSFIPWERSEPEIAAGIWCNINQMILDQFRHIDDGTNCKTVWIEDLNVEGYRELYDWLGLEGFDETLVSKYMNDERFAIRHSHQWDLDRKGQPSVTLEERAMIREKTYPFVESALGFSTARFAQQREPLPAVNLTNSTFEAWDVGGADVPLGWSTNAPNAIHKETEDTFERDVAAAVDVPEASYVNLFQYKAIPSCFAGNLLTVKSQGKSDTADTMRVKLHIEHEGEWVARASEAHPGNGKWEILEVTLPVPEGFQGGRIKVEGVHYGGASSACLFDGFTVTSPSSQ